MRLADPTPPVIAVLRQRRLRAFDLTFDHAHAGRDRLVAPRHIGPSPDERERMLQTIGVASLDALIDQALPAAIRLKTPLNLPPLKASTSIRASHHLARRNTPLRSVSASAFTTRSRRASS